MRLHTVTVLVAHAGPTIELAVPNAVFGTPFPNLLRDFGGVRDWYSLRDWYEVHVCSVELDSARQPVGPLIDASRRLELLAMADTIIVVAGCEIPDDPRADVRHALQQARARQTRIVGVGSGAFVLAAAGVLTGRRATAHWSVIDELRRRYPEVVVDDPALYTEDDGIFTSAGAAATLDLCLELVRQDHGAAVANALARWMVAPPHRSGNQPQFVAAPVPQTDDRLSNLLDWASARLDQPLTLADLAQEAGLTPRTLARRFHAALGTSPLQWLLMQRIRLAQQLLESTDHPIDQIAERSGLGTPGNLRHQFTKELGTSPRRYRQRFRRPGVDGPDRIPV
jgi:AraC family transcriptional activator FtrA